MLFIPGLEYLLSSLFKHKSSSRCKWIQTPDYRFRFSARWDGCSRPSPRGKLVSILKADGIAWQGSGGGSECESRSLSAFSENDPVITPDYLCARCPHEGHTQSHVCVPNHTLTNVYKSCLLSTRSLHICVHRAGAVRLSLQWAFMAWCWGWWDVTLTQFRSTNRK